MASLVIKPPSVSLMIESEADSTPGLDIPSTNGVYPGE